MNIHINKVRSSKRISSVAKGYQHRTGLHKTAGPELFPKRLLLFFGLLISLNNVVVAQSTTSNFVNLTNFVNKSQATQGQTITHTLVLANTGTTTASGILVRDSLSTGLRYLINTSNTPPGTTFTVGVPISTWSVPSLSAGQSVSLTYQAVADSSEVLYSIATIPGDTAASCISIPVKVCKGDTYLFQLTGPAGRNSYRWFKDDAEITSQTSRVLNVTAPGSYSLAIDGTAGQCPDFPICPFIVEEYALPAFQVRAVSASCSGSTPQANGQLKVTGFSTTDTYQYSEGPEFNPSASLPGTPAIIPADGLIVSNLQNPITAKTYTVRVYNASGCYVEKTVTLDPAPCCRLATTASPSVCDLATNTFSTTVVVTLVNPTIGVLTITDGPLSQTMATTGSTALTAVFANSISDGSSHNVIASLAGCSADTAIYTAPVSCSVAPAPTLPSLTLSVTDPGVCDPESNLYTSTGVISLSNAPEGVATVTDGLTTSSISVSAGATSLPYSLTGLLSGSGVHTVMVSFASQSASTTYVAPESCTIASPAPAVLALNQVVDKSRAKLGELISYTVVLTNTGASSSPETTIQLVKTAGLAYVTNSATPPAGTVFSPGTLSSSWSVPSLSAGQSVSLTFQAEADSSGILQNTATIPGDTVKVCTSVPVKVCGGESYLYRLTASPGRSQYQWMRTFQGVTTELTSFTTNILDVTQPGEYKLTNTSQTGQCPDFSCCPFIVEQDSLPTFLAKALSASCVSNNPQATGQLVISGFHSTNTYQYSLGSSFNESASLSGVNKAIPVDGVLANTLANPTVDQAYTIRVYNESGCYRDMTMILSPTACDCPALACTPLLLTQTKRGRRIGDPR